MFSLTKTDSQKIELYTVEVTLTLCKVDLMEKYFVGGAHSAPIDHQVKNFKCSTRWPKRVRETCHEEYRNYRKMPDFEK